MNYQTIARDVQTLSRVEQFQLACEVWDNLAIQATEPTSDAVLALLSERAKERDAGKSVPLNFAEMGQKLGMAV